MVNPFLWAKKKSGANGYEWLPLSQHLVDCCSIGMLLWEHWLSPGQTQRLCDELGYQDPEEGKQLFGLLCALHDIGKATPAFQLCSNRFSTPDLEKALLEKLASGGYQDVDVASLSNPEKSHHTTAGQVILHDLGLHESFCCIIGAHHGKPVDSCEIYDVQRSYPRNYYQVEDPSSPVYQKWQTTQRDVFDWAMDYLGYDSPDEVPEISAPSQVILSALLIVADWVASNNEYFPLFRVLDDDLQPLANVNQDSRIQTAFERWAKTDLWIPEDILTRPGDLDQAYRRRFSFTPRDAQRRLAELIGETTDPGFFIFEAPMGLGKTEAALVAVEQLASSQGRSGLFFGLPTQATSNGIFPRINDWLSRMADSHDEHYGLRLAHGKAALNDDFVSLASSVNVDGDSIEPSVVINEWFAGRKKTSLDDFVVGTVDQLLLMSLKQKHVALRHLGFDKKVVVIDEVHAYDTYMNQYLGESLRWLGRYHVPVVLLSATLPAKRRETLIQQYMLGKGIRERDIRRQLEMLSTDSYPLVTYSDGEEIRQYEDFDPRAIDTRRVKIQLEDEEHLIEVLRTLLRNGGCIGIIVNTVRKAQRFYEEIATAFGENNVEILHSNFIATDRMRKENELLQMIGKGASRPERKIIIGTQVIEQSLDIDFDALITELAPMDLLIQRIGRLHRHNIPRPEGHEDAICYVLDCNQDHDFDAGSKAVYGSYLLFRTQYYLPEEIILPWDISRLVQKVYAEDGSDDELELNDDDYDFYREALTEHENKIEGQESRAQTYLLRERDLRKAKNLVGWLNQSSKVTTEEESYAQVRDSEETIEVIALQRRGKNGLGYGFFSDDEDLSDRLSEGDVSRKISQHSLRLPLALSRPWKIEETIKLLEQYNIENLPEWRRDPWLNSALGIIFDENGVFEIGDFRLIYDCNKGLSYEKKSNRK